VANTGCECALPIVVLVLDTLGPFPVINHELTRVLVTEHHINRPRNLDFLIINTPLCAIGLQVLEILGKSLKILELDARIVYVDSVIETLDVIVGPGSGTRCAITVCVPGLTNIIGGHSMVLVFGVGHLRALDDVLDDGFTIKYGKMMVIPGGYRGISLLSMYGVDMRTFIESDELVTGVCVLEGEHLLRSVTEY
jgi:hypothetical protein